MKEQLDDTGLAEPFGLREPAKGKEPAQAAESTQTNPLITSIIEDAETEAKRIIAQATRSGELQVSGAEKRAQDMVKKAKEEAEQKRQRQITQVEATLEMEKKRLNLQRKAAISNRVLELLDQRFQAIVDTPRYRTYLKQWLTEAVVGLERPWAEVVTSPSDPVDEALLEEVTTKSKQALGYPVTLVLAKRKDPTIQGVMVYSKDKKTAYNNTVETRTKRYATEMYRMIHSEVLRSIYE